MHSKAAMNPVDRISRRVTLRELRLLLAVARSGSILKAAQDIGLTQPAVSKSIADLESTMGVRLFDRTNRGVEPTPQGHVLLRRAAGVFQELRQAVDELNFLADSGTGHVRIGGTPGMCAGLLPHAIGSIQAERPRMRYQVVELESEKLGREILARSIDASVGREPALIGENNISFERLFEDRLFIVAGEQHPLARRPSIRLEDAAAERWVLPILGTPITQQLQGAFKRLGMSLPQATVTTMSMLIRYELLATSRFLTVMYGSVLTFGSIPRGLKVLPVDLSAGISIGLARLQNRTLTPAVELFLEGVRKLAQPMRSLDVQRLRRTLRGRS
jgi:DNA-binding transcriptional LysR family regulator